MHVYTCKGYDSFDVGVSVEQRSSILSPPIEASQGSLEQVTEMGRTTIALLVSICVGLCCGIEGWRQLPGIDLPFYISREEWGARPPKDAALPLSVYPPEYVVIHHSETVGCTNQMTCAARVRSIQDFHMDTKNWDDIGYNFIIGEDGNHVYVGRGWGKRGAHSKPYNSKSIGVCFIGNFTNVTPGSTVIATFKNLTSYGVENGYLKSNFKILGHRQTTPTDCPGNALYELIQTWPEWTNSA